MTGLKLYTRVVKGEKALNDETLQRISDYRWGLFKQGLEAVKKDWEEFNIVHILLGHGLEPGKRLEPKPTVNGRPMHQYESIFLLTEYIERGLIGTIAVVWIMIVYYTSLIRLRIENPLTLSFLLAPSIKMAVAVFTFFWDAMLPLYLLLYRIGYEYETKRR